MNITRLYARTGTVPLTTQISKSLLSRSNNRTYLILAAIGVPAAFYLSSRSNSPNPKPISTFDERHGIDPHPEGQGQDPAYDASPACRAWGAPKETASIPLTDDLLNDDK
ncbi:hypothetical protein N7490_010932 [Penicillium lividum]|nr:hypothetical protein N7490_010932 [Penicillium lividum]